MKAARKEFCGPKKAIPKEVMAQLDKDIKDAKAREKNTKDAEARGNRTLKKQLKQRLERLGMAKTKLLTSYIGNNCF